MKFKVGDRVAIYGRDFDGKSSWYARAGIATVVRIVDENEVICRVPDHALLMSFHPKQCRKLKKKPRRRVWVHRARLEPGHKTEDFSTQPSSREHDGMIEFIEVRRKK